MRLQIAGVVFLGTMLYLASQGDRHENIGISQVEERRIEEADIARQVAVLDERDRKREFDKHHPSPRAHQLGDGIHGDIPIGELMDGFRGFL
jgi:hypothetical protein